MNLAHWLERSARQWPDRPALVLGREVVADYRRFALDVAAMAHTLSAQYAVLPGDRVAVLAANCPKMLVAMYATWHCGAVAVPVNAKLHPNEARFILGD
ncbi:MAG: AMP-binding protein, partial [Betaproteobacteria bacterium]|nr:AMP-binding protein [Betaproteobacteria bacterium]